MTSHVDISTTLLSMAKNKSVQVKELPGKGITPLLGNPEAASTDALRPGTMYNYNMFAYIDAAFLPNIAKFFAEGGNPEEIANQGFRPNLKKRGAIRSVYDGEYKLSRYFSPLEHHVPHTIEQLFANKDVELCDLKNDPLEVKNLTMDNKLNLLIEDEVGEDVGQMLPSDVGAG